AYTRSARTVFSVSAIHGSSRRIGREIIVARRSGMGPSDSANSRSVFGIVDGARNDAKPGSMRRLPVKPHPVTNAAAARIRPAFAAPIMAGPHAINIEITSIAPDWRESPEGARDRRHRFGPVPLQALL